MSDNETPNFEPISDEERTKLQVQSNSVYGTLADDESIALSGYTRKKYLDVNSALWDGSYAKKPKILSLVKSIDGAIAKFEVKDRITVFRGTDAGHYNGLEVGDAAVHKSFMSTSVDRGVAEEFSDNADSPAILEINVPRGTRGMYLGSNSEAALNEAEFLLGRGTLLKLAGRDGNTLKMEVIK